MDGANETDSPSNISFQSVGVSGVTYNNQLFKESELPLQLVELVIPWQGAFCWLLLKPNGIEF